MCPQKTGFLHTMACLRAKKSAILGTLAENRACSGAQIWYTKSRKSPGGPVRKSEGKHHGRLSGIPAAGAAQALAQAVHGDRAFAAALDGGSHRDAVEKPAPRNEPLRHGAEHHPAGSDTGRHMEHGFLCSGAAAHGAGACRQHGHGTGFPHGGCAAEHGCGKKLVQRCELCGRQPDAGDAAVRGGNAECHVLRLQGCGPECDRQRHHLQACRWHDRGAAGSPDRSEPKGGVSAAGNQCTGPRYGLFQLSDLLPADAGHAEPDIAEHQNLRAVDHAGASGGEPEVRPRGTEP